MKNLLFSFMVFATIFSLQAQIKTPVPSPFSTLEQKVGLTDITVEYSRPGVKGRIIFGDLVPFNKIWRTGANARTKISLSTKFTVADETLKPGSYNVFVIPNKSSWEVVFYDDGKSNGTPSEFDEAYVAARTIVNTQQTGSKVETFTIGINNITNSSATLDLSWEKTSVSIPFSVPTDVAVVSSIESTMNGPGVNDYYQAAVYYFQEGKDISQAKEWIDKAIEMTQEKPRFWMLRQQSLIHAQSGDRVGAIEAAKKSLESAKKAGNMEYVKFNKAALKEWGAL